MLNTRGKLEEIKGLADEISVECRQKRKGNQDRKQCEDSEYLEAVVERVRLQVLQAMKILYKY